MARDFVRLEWHARALRGLLLLGLLLASTALRAEEQAPARSASSPDEELIEVQLKMAALYEAKGDLTNAAKALSELLARYPEEVRILERAARLAHGQNLTRLALEVGQRLVRTRPTVARYRIWLVAALLAAKRSAEAAPHLEWLAQHQPSDAEVRKELARIYEDQHQPAKALEQYDWLIARFPRDVEYRLARSQVYGTLGRDKEQRAELGLLLRMAPDNVDVRIELAEQANEEEEFDEVERQVRAILAVEPKHRRALALRAQLEGARVAAARRAAEAFLAAERYADFLIDLREREEDF